MLSPSPFWHCCTAHHHRLIHLRARTCRALPTRAHRTARSLSFTLRPSWLWLDGFRCLDETWELASSRAAASREPASVLSVWVPRKVVPPNAAASCLPPGAEAGDSNAASTPSSSPAESNSAPESTAPVCSHGGLWRANRSLGAWPVHV